MILAKKDLADLTSAARREHILTMPLVADIGMDAQARQYREVIDTSRLTNLCAVCDNPSTGHVSIIPRDLSEMPGWIASRGTGEVHPLTKELMDAVVDTVKK